MPTSPKSVLILILQYNSPECTIECLRSVDNLGYPNFAVLVLDNASDRIKQDFTREFIKKNRWKHTIQFRALLANTGYAGGNNFGLCQAREAGVDYILILNNDTVVPANLLAELIKTGEADQTIGLVGPLSNEGNNISHGGEVSWLKSELSHHPQPVLQSELQASGYIAGSGLLIKRAVLDKVGELDERYFLYFEDADYSRRAARAGYQLAVTPAAIIQHQVSASTRQLGRPTVAYYHYRNAHLFNFTHGPFWVKLVLPGWSFFIIIKQLVKLVMLPASSQIARAILQGVTDFYRGKFGKRND